MTFVDSLPASLRQSILWFVDYEDQTLKKWEDEGTGNVNAGGGIFITDDVNSSYGIEDQFTHSGAYSVFATIQNAITPGQVKAVRLMRWTDKSWNDDGDYFPDSAYYSTFFLLRNNYDPKKEVGNDPFGDGGWWNVFQFKSNNYEGSQPVVALDVYANNGHMYFGLSVKDYSDDYSSNYVQAYHIQTHPIDIPVNSWNHIEAYYKKSKTYNGQVIIWQNGVKIFEIDNIRTQLPPSETVVFGIGNYTDYISGGPVTGEATVYFDDAIISTSRISVSLY